MNSWDNLSMQERATVMRLAVENGIYSLDTIRGAYNEYAKGGSIHIKPSHRGRLTELKKRTGKSEAELYNDGNPAHKKMVVFARNARKWKHGLGGNLFDDGGDTDKPNIFKVTDGTGAARYIYRETPDSEEITVRPLSTIFPNPAEWTFTDDNGKYYTPRRTTPINTAELNPDNRTGFERFVNNYIGEATNTIPKGYHTLPAIAAGAFGLASPALGEAALTSAFAGHGLSKVVNGEIDGPIDGALTALELAPLGRLAKPVYEGVVQPSMRLFNSPLTGNWTKIGSREYRLSPNSLGANGSPLESKGIAPQITAENAASITPAQWTAAQDAAIARGDMAEAQRLRDLHFKVSAPNTQIVDKNGNPIHSYHGTGKHFNEFDTTGKYSTLDEGYYGKGAYFAPNKELAQMYADTERTPIMYDTYLNIKNPLRYVRDENADLYGKAIVDNDGVISTLPDDLVDKAFDMTEYVATKPNQIKSADAVTYDDNGIRIPLGKRDNFNMNDIRYGLLPFLGLGAAGTLYSTSNR